MMVEVRAGNEMDELLEYISERGRLFTRWITTDRVSRDFHIVPGTRFTRKEGIWYALEERPEAYATRTPDIAVDADAYARKVASTVPSQADVNEAFRGLKPTPVETPEGGVRIDYDDIPLKNTDGTLTRYAKNMLDLSAPQARAGSEFAGELQRQIEREQVEKPDGTVVAIPVRAAEPLLKAGKVRVARRRKRRSE